MNWAHLPEPGGLYAQHPDILDRFMHIFQERAKVESEQKKKEDREKEARRPGGRSRGGPRPRRR